MRELLFKGKRTDNGEWVSGYYVCKKRPYFKDEGVNLEHLICRNLEIEDGNCKQFVDTIMTTYAVDPETIGQYTGLTDMNGNKIYEGDIINVLQDRLMEVRWDFEELTWKLFDVGIPVSEINLYYNTIDLAALYLETCYENQMISEVVGNIYDNPELLKADKEKLKQITSRWYYG